MANLPLDECCAIVQYGNVTTRLTEHELLVWLAREAEKAGSQRALADRVGVSASYLSRVMGAKYPPSDAMLAALGLEREVTYVVRK